MARNETDPPVTPALLLRAYAAGVFPMAESADDETLLWFDPPQRGVLPLDDGFHIPHRLARTLSSRPYRVTLNTAFEAVMRGCAEPAPGRETTWINEKILSLYTALHRTGHAASIEVYEGDALIGGLYGVALGAAFFGESMFSRKTDASKIALAHLVALLRHHNYTLLDTQFITPHLARFGATEIPRATYHAQLARALATPAQPLPAQAELIYLDSGTLSFL